ncbi:hypothetical protein ABGB18_33240 [Nonomuraea sp. B12E4]|uniref:NACHT and WD40 repeat domain-containing protein n=1 Tax=Nonomuraea sp. B12E4 TaxID=3153564 RepID=UPI00325DE9C8
MRKRWKAALWGVVVLLTVVMAGAFVWAWRASTLTGNQLERASDQSALWALVVGLGALVLAVVAVLVALQAGAGAAPGDRLAQIADDLARAVERAERRRRDQMLGLDGGAVAALTLHPTRVRLLSPAQTPRDLSLGDVLDYLPRLSSPRVMVTGPAGVGKSVLLTQLTLSLLDRRKEGDGGHRRPVPLHFQLAGWDPAAQSFTEWLATRIARDFRITQRVAQELVDEHLIVPLLDGLDEMDLGGDTTRARAAVAQLGRYGEPRNPLVVAARTETYERLRDHDHVVLVGATDVEIQPLTRTKICAFLTDVAADRAPMVRDGWHAVVSAIHGGSAPVLEEVLSTPWLLTLAATAYRQSDPSGLLEFGDTQRAKAHLLEQFVGISVTRAKEAKLGPEADSSAEAERVRKWLSRLASWMESSGPRSEILLHEVALVSGGWLGRLLYGLVVHPIWTLCVLWAAFISSSLPPPVPGSFATTAPAFLQAALHVSLPVLSLWIAGAIRAAWLGGAPVTPSGFRRISAISPFETLAMVAVMLGVGAVVGLVVAIFNGPLGEGTGGFPTSVYFLACVSVGATMSLVAAPLYIVSVNIDVAEVSDPHQPVRADAFRGLWFGFVTGPLLGLATALQYGPWAGIWSTAAATALVAVVFMNVAVRQFIGAVSGWLTGRFAPRPARFLDWAVEVGIMRTSGAAYEFRHGDLRRWLAGTYGQVTWARPAHAIPENHGRVSRVLFHPDGGSLTVCADRATTRWRIEDGRPASRQGKIQPGRGPWSVTTADHHPGGELLATDGGRDRLAHLWDLTGPDGFSPVPDLAWDGTRSRDDKLTDSQNGEKGDEPTEKSAFALCFLPGTDVLATGQAGGILRLWDVSDRRDPVLLSTTTLAQLVVDTIAASRAAPLLATGSPDGSVSLWDVRDPTAPVTTTVLSGRTGHIRAICFSFDGRLLAAMGAGGVAVWDLRSETEDGTQPVSSLAVAPGRRRALAFHPGQPHVLAVGDLTGSVSFWNLGDPAQPQRFAQAPSAHGKAVTDLVFSPDGRLMATASLDGGVLLWHLHPALAGHDGSGDDAERDQTQPSA